MRATDRHVSTGDIPPTLVDVSTGDYAGICNPDLDSPGLLRIVDEPFNLRRKGRIIFKLLDQGSAKGLLTAVTVRTFLNPLQLVGSIRARTQPDPQGVVQPLDGWERLIRDGIGGVLDNASSEPL